MKITSAKFVTSSVDLRTCPPPVLPEYAFIGRSNVGKSSLINALTNKKDLAKTSSKPGKTQLINHFIINGAWNLVDLPGYGYATVSQEKRETFSQFTVNYLLKRENLMCVLVLIDARLPVQKIDAEFMEWLATKEVPFVIVFTKTDKLSATQLKTNTEAYCQQLEKSWEALPQLFYTSAVNQKGRDELLAFIESTNELFKKPLSH